MAPTTTSEEITMAKRIRLARVVGSTFVLAALRPDRIAAAVPFYGFPTGDDQPNYRDIEAAIQGHMAEIDDFFPPVGGSPFVGKVVSLLDAELLFGSAEVTM